MNNAALVRAAYACALASAACIPLSIAAFEALLGIALILLLAARAPLRFPPVGWPLLLFGLLTVAAVLASPDPRHGWPQIRKLSLYAILLVLPSLLRGIVDAQRVVLLWAATGSIAALRGVQQFYCKWHHARGEHQDFYQAYVADRITGFSGHWMTFSGLEMMILLFVAALLLAGIRAPERRWLVPAGLLIGAALFLGWTRTMWGATALGLVYLVAVWRPRYLLAVPVVAGLVFAVAPAPFRTRITSVYQPQGDTDSNRHRLYTARTGFAMIAAHPWLGLGPEQIGRQFDAYLPEDLARPKPVGYYGHLHNVYLQFAAERGLPALFALLWLIGRAWWDVLRGLQKGLPGRAILHGCVAVIGSMMLAGTFEYNLGDSEPLAMFLCVIAIGYVVLWDVPVESSRHPST